MQVPNRNEDIFTPVDKQGITSIMLIIYNNCSRLLEAEKNKTVSAFFLFPPGAQSFQHAYKKEINHKVF